MKGAGRPACQQARGDKHKQQGAALKAKHAELTVSCHRESRSAGLSLRPWGSAREGDARDSCGGGDDRHHDFGCDNSRF